MIFAHRDLIAIEELTRGEILHLIQFAKQLKSDPQPHLLKGKILVCCFFEPSTRTRLSLESAMYRLGGSVIGFSGREGTSAEKGESLSDTIRVVSGYADLLAIRHPLEGAAQLAADLSPVPVINAGDGANQHPTQTLLDLMTIEERQGTLDGLKIALMGDLRHSRTVHSLVKALSHFDVTLYFSSPEQLEISKELCVWLRENRVKFSFQGDIQAILHKVDLLYLTRPQQERFSRDITFSSGQPPYRLRAAQLQGVKPNFMVMHPLPRTTEIDVEIDQSPHAAYFEQSVNGLYMRQALMALLLGMEVIAS